MKERQNLGVPQWGAVNHKPDPINGTLQNSKAV